MNKRQKNCQDTALTPRLSPSGGFLDRGGGGLLFLEVQGGDLPER